MWIIGILALVIGIIALARAKACCNVIRKQQTRINSLEREVIRLGEAPGPPVEEILGPPPAQVTEEPPPVADQQWQPEASVTEPAEVPVLMPESPTTSPEEIQPEAGEPKLPPPVTPTELHERPPLEATRSPLLYTDRQKWARLEEKLGKQWTTWVGAVVFILSAGFFVKYPFFSTWRTSIRISPCGQA